MILQIFGVLDEKAGYYGHPFFAVAAGQAVRMFTDWCNDRNTPLGKHPRDYRLFKLGRFDDADGRFEGAPVPEFLVSGGDVLESGNE